MTTISAEYCSRRRVTERNGPDGPLGRSKSGIYPRSEKDSPLSLTKLTIVRDARGSGRTWGTRAPVRGDPASARLAPEVEDGSGEFVGALLGQEVPAALPDPFVFSRPTLAQEPSRLSANETRSAGSHSRREHQGQRARGYGKCNVTLARHGTAPCSAFFRYRSSERDRHSQE